MYALLQEGIRVVLDRDQQFKNYFRLFACVTCHNVLFSLRRCMHGSPRRLNHTACNEWNDAVYSKHLPNQMSKAAAKVQVDWSAVRHVEKHMICS